MDAALAELRDQIAEAERKIAVRREAEDRAPAADELVQQIAAIEAALPPFLGASRALAGSLTQLGGWHFESGQMAVFTGDACSQVELATPVTLAELKAIPDGFARADPAPAEETRCSP
ncbi:hypothetical protein [Bradyrhizobium sp. CCBAU 53380]|uniref:hypothetical protein n=1 Tax=Bradyrhizobium sp. CCBAU 53380 TaxID=1325117 RepID=UPI002302D420|nr:hypothetical protein [Bradyrhizobium sp. CCBAU 53380]MDA9427126.1 hypothetical protein [Bradyrhizobium sp. CCBAU 53380]